MRRFRRDQRGGSVRLAVLIGALVITVVWAQWETKPRRGSPAGGPKTGRGVAVAAPAPATPTVTDDVTPEGWGTDPFDPRPLGSTAATTGR
jgi:hypothetical protein